MADTPGVFSTRRTSPREILFVGALVATVLAAVAGLAWAVPLEVALPGGGAPLPVRGRAVFIRERCFYCHTLESTRPEARRPYRVPSYTTKLLFGWSSGGPDLAFGAHDRTSDWELAHLLEPRAVVGGSVMLAAPDLSDRDTTAVIAFVGTGMKLRGTAPVTPSASRGTTVEALPLIAQSRRSYLASKRLYAFYCTGCHGEFGNGAGDIGQVLDPEPRDLADSGWMKSKTDRYLFTKITSGKARAAMPPFSDILTPYERALVVRYIRYFADAVAKERLEEGLPR